MLFSERYPTAKPGDQIGYDFIVTKKKDNCVWCGRMTNFKLEVLGVYLCSEECDDAWYADFLKHCEK